jgi:hypothetical protein
MLNAEVGEFTHDFFYLPIDLRSRANMGYAFLNLCHPLIALKFFQKFNNRAWDKFESEKICQVQFS